MRRPLTLPFAILGAAEGWLLVDAVDSGFQFSSPSGWRPCALSVAVNLVAGAALGCLIARGASVARFVGSAFLVGAVSAAVQCGIDGGHASVVLMGALYGALLQLVIVPFFLPAFLAHYRARARHGSVLGRVEARGVWLGVCVGIALATAFTSHGRGWCFNGLVGYRHPRTVGADVEHAMAGVVAIGAAVVTALDARALALVDRIAALDLRPRSVHVAALDLGIGDAELARSDPRGSYREAAVVDAVRGDPEATRRALRRRVTVDVIALVVTIVALLAFKGMRR